MLRPIFWEVTPMSMPGKQGPYDVIIIGGGPAGFTAGLYAARAGLAALLVEGAATVSQITVTDVIENYPGIPEGINGFELVERFRRQASSFGLEITRSDVKGLFGGPSPAWSVEGGGAVWEAPAVIIATGASWRKLGVPGEEALTGRGVSYCATCDAPFYRHREVVVVGGGNAAVQEALFLTNFASRVTIVHRRDRLRASEVLRRRALQNPRIAFAWDSVIDEIRGREGVEGVLIRNVKTNETREMKTDGVFVFVGLEPNTAFCRGVVATTPEGAVIVDRAMRTSAAGVFACGDCTDTPLRQVITACGDGAQAAYSAQLYVEAVKGETYG